VDLPFGWSYPWGGTEVWPYVSNIADLFLIIGIGILVIRALRQPKQIQIEHRENRVDQRDTEAKTG